MFSPLTVVLSGAGHLDGYIQVGYRVTLHIDGVEMVTDHHTQPGYPVWFSVPHTWSVVVIHADSGATGSKFLIASIGDDTYTNASGRWRCEGVAAPGWEHPWFDDSQWNVAKNVGMYKAAEDADVDSRARRIWGQLTSGDAYCRGSHAVNVTSTTSGVCDVTVSADHGDFTKVTPADLRRGMRRVSSHVTRSTVECGARCLRGATSCHHSTGAVCEPPDVSGCCGYLYDEEGGVCDLYTGTLTGEAVITPYHGNWYYYQLDNELHH